MTAVLVAGSVMLVASSLLLLARMTVGPTMLDRVIAFDVVTSVSICALALEAAVHQHAHTVPILVALSLLGFVGSVSVASFTKSDELVQEDEE
jgi:multicomponent Na+:H+ antiporter subunit F